MEPTLLPAAFVYGIPSCTLQSRLQGAQPSQTAHQKQQLSVTSERKAAIQFCVKLDNLGYPLKSSYYLQSIKELFTCMLLAPPLTSSRVINSELGL